MNPIYTIKTQTLNVLVMVISAVTMALGVALLSNYVTEKLDKTWVLGCVGFFVVCFSFYLIGLCINPKVKLLLKITGGFFFEPTSLKGKEILGYEFNRDMNEYLRAIAVENKAFAKSLAKGHECGLHFKNNYNPEKLDYYNMAASCAEFIFLNQLSLHLNSYYTSEEIDNKFIKVIPRVEMSQKILRNRVLELITRDYLERDVFSEENTGDDDAVLYYAIGEDGEVFNRLELELPLGTVLERNDDNSLRIENDVFKMNFIVRCDGTSTVVAPELIVGEYDAPCLVSIKMHIAIKKRFFLKKSDIQLYQWLDSFISEFEEYMSIEKLHARSYLQLVKVLKYSNIH